MPCPDPPPEARRARVAIINDTARSGHFGCRAVMSSLVAHAARHGMEAVAMCPVDMDWEPRAKMLRQAGLDAIIVNGEGSIHHTATRRKARQLCRIGRFARDVLGVPVFLVNATIDSIDSDAAGDLARFDGVYVRESRSRDDLRHFGIESRVVPDLSVYSPLVACDLSLRSAMVVTDSVLVNVSAQLASFAAERSLRFIAMETRRRETLATRAAAGLRRRFRHGGRAARPRSYHKSTDFADFIGTLATARGAITGRFHTLMLCMAVGTPCLAVESNTPKIGNVLQDAFGSRKRIVTTDDLLRIPASAMPECVEFTECEKALLEEYLARGEGDMEAMFSRIGAAAGARGGT